MLRFTKFRVGLIGPEIAVYAADIVAIEQAAFDPHENRWRSRLHLRGGSTLDVAEYYHHVLETVNSAHLTAAAAGSPVK